ncbi:D-alanine--D-alanine ligase B [Gammaproteobacteria bacterium]
MGTSQSTISNPDLGRVAVLMGGQSGERAVSLNSGGAVLAALLRRKVDAIGIDAGRDVLDQLARGNFDRVFIALHGRGGEDGTLQGGLEILGLPYTGSGVLGSALGMDKCRAKQLWAGVGLPTPAFRVLTVETDLDGVVEELGLPLAVKPSREGSSLGVARVDDATALAAAYAQAAALDPEVIAERWIVGREYTVGLLGGMALPVIELEVARGFYDYHAKYEANDTIYRLPCGLSEAEEAILQRLAVRAFAALGCSGWGRVDIMRDATGTPWLLEVNTAPGMTDHSLVPMAARAAGIEFDELVVRILEMAGHGQAG